MPATRGITRHQDLDDLHASALVDGNYQYWDAATGQLKGAPVSFAAYARLDGATFTGAVVLNGGVTVDNLGGVLKAAAGVVSGGASTADLPENAANLYYTDVRADGRITLQKGVAGGLASLDGAGRIPNAQLPALAITDTSVVASQVAMLALAAERGDVAVRSDLNKSFILAADDPTVLANWQELLTPTDTVLSVNGFTGAVLLTTTNINEGTNAYYTDARARAAISVAGAPLTYNSGTGVLGFSSPLATTLGGTGLATYATGDVIYASAANTLSKLAAGAQNYTLQMGAAVPAWSSVWMRDTSGTIQYIRPADDTTQVRIGAAAAVVSNAMLGVRRDTATALDLGNLNHDLDTVVLSNRSAAGTVYSAVSWFALNSNSVYTIQGRVGIRREGDTRSAYEVAVTTTAGALVKVLQAKRGGVTIGAGSDFSSNVNISYALYIGPTAETTAKQTVYIQDRTATTGITGIDVQAGQGQSTNYLLRFLGYSASIAGGSLLSEFDGTGRLGLGIAPTYGLHLAFASGLTAGQTAFIQDATAATGVTTVKIQAGAAQSSSDLLQYLDNLGNIAANMNLTDGLSVNRLAAGHTGFACKLTASTVQNYSVLGDGTVRWSDGSAAVDTTLVRQAAGVLRTANIMDVTSALSGGINTGYRHAGYDAIGSVGNDIYFGGFRNAQWSGIGFYTSNTQRVYIDTNGLVGINTVPDASARLHIVSITRGVILPVMTAAQRDAIAAPATGLLAFSSTQERLCAYDGVAWRPMEYVGGTKAIVVAGAAIATNADDPYKVYTVSTAANVTVSNPTGSPYDGQTITWRIKNTGGGAITVSVGTKFRFGTNFTAFSNISAGKKTYVTAIYDSADDKWDAQVDSPDY